MTEKPTPHSTTFKGCPPEGQGGDPRLNRLKNRIDVADEWIPVSFSAVLKLPWPEEIPHKRDQWTQAQARQVAKFEGVPISVECYVLEAHKAGKESCNCGKTSADMVDYHIGLVNSPDDDLNDAVVAEVTPRLRDKHPEWTLREIKQLARQQAKVRISGWLMLDQMHEDMVEEGHRGTIWEIHPVMEIEFWNGNAWSKLDSR